jgi:citrate synthase
LRGVTVADTKISFIDGEQGILIYRGYRIEELAKSSSYLETAYLLLQGTLPNREELAAFSRQIAAARKIPEFLVETLKKLPWGAHPMDVLQASLPILAMADPDLQLETREAGVRKAIRPHRPHPGLRRLAPDPQRFSPSPRMIVCPAENSLAAPGKETG